MSGTAPPIGLTGELIDTADAASGVATDPQSEHETKSNWRFTTRRGMRWLSTILMIVILFLAWPLARGGLFSYTGVSGESMEPTYHTGDVAMTIKRSEYQVGDIIVYTVTFEDKVGATVHRVIEALPDGDYRTQSDSNEVVDP